MLSYELYIKTELGRIGIETYRGDFSLIKKDPGFDMKVTKPEIYISTTYPEIEIDSSRCRAEMGNPSLPEAVLNWRDEGRQAAMDYIDKKVAQGNLLGDIRRKVSIGDIAYKNAFPDPPEFNIDAIPKSRPLITLKEGRVDIDFAPGDVKVSMDASRARFHYESARVNIFLEKEPYIEIKAVYVGKHLDVKA
ncbi:MAG: DUF6470 family protein [Tepidanaerobacteraceae bacterium]|jgi:hypothetical protein|nr:DUF6470 family protein [Tepidanaerobacteraceae bacterium]